MKPKITSNDYLFAHLVCEIPDIYENEQVVAEHNIKEFNKELSSFALVFGEMMIEHYYEWFNESDSELWESFCETFTKQDEEIIIQSLPEDERNLVLGKPLDEWPLEEIVGVSEAIWKVIVTHINETQQRVIDGRSDMKEIKVWIKEFNDFMETVVGMVENEKPYFHIQLGDVADFPNYFLQNLLDRIEYHHDKGITYVLVPFQKSIYAMLRTVQRVDLQNDGIAFGRFLELLNFFNNIVCED